MKLLRMVQKFKDGLAVSPYPLSYTLAYPWYAHQPSFRNHSGVSPAPLVRRPAQEDNSLVRLVFFGDLVGLSAVPIIDDKLRQVFSRADLVIGNLTGLCGERTGDNLWEQAIDPDFLVKLFSKVGVSTDRLVISVANNHAQDAGDQGLETTLRTFSKHHIDTVGQITEGRPTHLVRTLPSGLSVGIWAWTHWLNNSTENGFRDPTNFGILHSKQAPELLSSDAVDTTVVLPHWDYEYQHFPSRATRDFAKTLAAQDVDIVGGCHPHVLQPIEKFGDCHILYSSGNFLQGNIEISRSLSSRLGALWEIMLFTKGSKRGKVAGYQLHPFVHDRQSNSLRSVDPKDQDAYKILNRIYALPDRSFEQLYPMNARPVQPTNGRLIEFHEE
ncbi:CapA family protein [Leptothoe spongobia]|uniref:CapA family protein n=1 Tax=Leptothoe spongobia TAU-MAC 1115 TaxID=1967444 RepID=A0A947DCN0_9CYAN|nr:CapA family protein [Leptothoe spongobia]MBT9314059.1 CapA family protein [Leptothoe spongobia TAU-MAC 1115]